MSINLNELNSTYLYRSFNIEKLNSNSWYKIIPNYRNYKMGSCKRTNMAVGSTLNFGGKTVISKVKMDAKLIFFLEAY